MTPIDTDTPLPDDIAAAHRLIRELLATLREQTHLNANLQHQLEQLLRKLYGRKSETLDPNQLLLFAREILEAGGPEIQPEPVPEPTPVEKPPAQGHGRKPLPASLPRRTVLHDVAPEDRPCPDCGEVRQPFSEDVREQLEYVPASLIILRHVRPKYACKACCAHVVIAQRLPEPIEKGLPGPGLLAHVAVSKYADHQPLYRQEGILKRFGVDLSRSTLCDWMAAAAGLLAPIVREMLKRVLRSEVIQTDDTPVKVQDHHGKGIKTGRLWVQIGDHKYHYTVYDYTPDRSADGPRRVFKDYKGYLQADAYSAYDSLFAAGTIREVGCWMHARRKFYEAKTSDPVRSHLVLAWVGGLYEIEEDAKKARKKHPEWDDAAWHAFRHELRWNQSRPILEAIHAWLVAERPRVLPKSPFGEAITYALNHWSALIRPLDAGFLEIDNGASERALKPVALGRKNWLFAGSDEGGKTAATLMSLCTTCKDLGVEPFGYLRDVLGRVSTHPNSRIEELLPDRWKPAESADPPGRKGSIKARHLALVKTAKNAGFDRSESARVFGQGGPPHARRSLCQGLDS
jgi:transposase